MEPVIIRFEDGNAFDVRLVDYRQGMLDPSHPGESILLGCLGEGLDALGAAALLDTPQAVHDEVLAGRAPATPDLTRRMEDAGWSSASFWAATPGRL